MPRLLQDGNVVIDIDPGALGEDVTISITETVFEDPEVDIGLEATAGQGQAIAFYDFEPDGLLFVSDVTLTIIVDVSDINPNLHDNLDLYRFEDTDNPPDGIADTFVSLGAICDVIEEPLRVFTGTRTFQLNHFSTYALVVPLDSDGDGVPDDFDDVMDECRNSDTTASVVIQSCDSGVDNRVLESGCTISDEVMMCSAGASKHAHLVRCINELLLSLKKKNVGIITTQEAAAIMFCAASSGHP